MTNREYEVYRTFYNNQDKMIRVRYHKGELSDKICAALFMNDFIKLGYSKSEVNKLHDEKIILKKKIFYNGGHRNVVLWLGQELTSHVFYKRWIQKIKLFFKKLGQKIFGNS